MKRRTFLKAIGLGTSLVPVIANAKLKPKVFPIEEVKLFIGGEEIVPFVQEGLMEIPPRLMFSPPQHINCRCSVEITHDHSLDAWANITGIARKPLETDSELRKRVLARRKGE